MLQLSNPINAERSPEMPRKDRAAGQGMVEFALVLPLLLLLVLGVIELGRMLVIYSSVSAASREAARYASAAGMSENGVPYYLDQTGMVEAARRVAFFTAVQVDPGPDIWYDHGPNGTTFDPASASDVHLGDRVNIRVTAQYTPFLGLTPLQAFSIPSITSRTIVKEVAVGPGAGGGGGGTTNNPPEVIIERPSNGAIFNQGDTVEFYCTGSDPDGDTVTITWEVGGSVVAGPNPGAVGYSTSGLAPGDHTFTCRGTDTNGAEDTETVTIQINRRPTIYISTPSDPSTFDQFVEIAFTAVVDDDDPIVPGNVLWFEGSTQIGTGLNLNFTPVGLGVHQIRAEYSDVEGAAAIPDTVTVVIVQPLPPTLEIITPVNGVAYAINTVVVFGGQANSYLGVNLSHLIFWSSNLDGDLGSGANISINDLQAGRHTITATVTDPLSGLTSSATVSIEIVNDDPPVVNILSPQHSGHFSSDQLLTFSATAVDAQDGNVAADLEWFSSIDGPFGNGASFPYSDLTVGLHTIHANVTDSDGLTGTDFIQIWIESVPNTPPVVTITSPADGYSVREGTPITFAATAVDAQEGNIAHLLRWIDELNTSLHAGATFSTATLSPGPHVITATVTDSGGLSHSDSVNITVRELICPTPGSPTFTGTQNNHYNKVTWPVSAPTTEVYRLEELSVTLPNSSAEVTLIQRDVDLLSIVPDPPLWSAGGAPNIWEGNFANGGVMTFTFTWDENIHRNTMPYLLRAKFEGCDLIQMRCTSATNCTSN